jgi:hypothetical protein
MRIAFPVRPRPAFVRSAVLPLLALALLAGLATPADAQWKWRDASGQVNVSDLPPPRDVAEKDILARPAPPARVAAAAAPAASAPAAAASATAPASPLAREAEARKRAAEQEQQARLKADEAKLAAARAENCQRARGQAAALESGQRMARVNDKGETVVLDDKARAEELRRTREIIASDCR